MRFDKQSLKQYERWQPKTWPQNWGHFTGPHYKSFQALWEPGLKSGPRYWGHFGEGPAQKLPGTLGASDKISAPILGALLGGPAQKTSRHSGCPGQKSWSRYWGQFGVATPKNFQAQKFSSHNQEECGGHLRKISRQIFGGNRRSPPRYWGTFRGPGPRRL